MTNGIDVTPELVTGIDYRKLPRAKPGRRTSLTQVLAMQDALYEACMIMKEDCRNASDKEERAKIAGAMSNTCKGWEALEDRKRVIRGLPLPGSLRPESKPRKPKSDNLPSPTEAPVTQSLKESTS